MPATSSTDSVMEAARDLTAALKIPHPNTPCVPIKDAQLSALRQLTEIFSANITTAPTPSPTNTSAPRVVAPRTTSITPSLTNTSSPRVVEPPIQVHVHQIFATLIPGATTTHSFLRSGRNRPIFIPELPPNLPQSLMCL